MRRSNADDRDATKSAGEVDAKSAPGGPSGVKLKAAPPPLPPSAGAPVSAPTTQGGPPPLPAAPQAAPPPLPPPSAATLPQAPRSSATIRASLPTEDEARSATSYSRVGRRSSPGMPAVAVSPVVAMPKTPVQSRPTVPEGALNLGPPGDAGVPQPPPSTPQASATPSRSFRRPNVAHYEIEIDDEGPRTQKQEAPPAPSVRPPAPEPFSEKSSKDESIAQTFDRLLDSRFAEIKGPSDRPSAPTLPEGIQSAELAEVRELFEQLAANHVRQVRDFLIDLKWGEASRDWLAICEPAVRSLRHGADNLDLKELREALDTFATALNAAAAEGAPTIEGATRDLLLGAYDRLIALLPKAFALDMDRTQREAVIVQSLLLQIPDVRRATIDRLYAAGLNGMSELFSARADEIAATAGIPQQLAERIVERFRSYKKDLGAAGTDATRAHERSTIASLVSDLATQNDEFERVATLWTIEATEEKKRLRRARERTLMQINVLLARLGEVGRLREIEKLPFSRKLDELRAFLREAQEKYVAAS